MAGDLFLQTAETRVGGGGEGTMGLYGTITRTGVARIMASLRVMCGMGRESIVSISTLPVFSLFVNGT